MADTPRRVAVIGEALIDRFPDGDVIGGAPFNVARNLALLGVAPLMITRIGGDPLGATIVDDFARHGMAIEGLQQDPQRPTGTVTVHMTGTHHTFEIGADSAWDHLDAARAVRDVQALAPGVVYFGTLAQRGPVSRAAVQAVLGATNAVPFLDLNLRDGPDNRTLAEDSLTRAALVKINDDELDRLVDWFVDPGAPAMAWGAPGQREAAETLVRRFGLQRMTITRGAAGWACVDGAGQWLEGRAAPVSVRDTVGAGDAFASVLLLGELHGWPLLATLQRAGEYASSVCGIAGAVDPHSGIYAAARSAWSLDSDHVA